jgi:23S rRNA-/tRNA-specific pseudouridylate synthase
MPELDGDAEAGTCLDKVPRTWTAWIAAPAAAIDRGKVYLNASLAADGSTRLAQDDVVRVWMDKPGSARRPTRPGPRGDLDIAYEDDVLVVVNKPPGVLTVPLERRRDAPSVFDQIVMYLAGRQRRPFVVHRIDQDWPGLVAPRRIPPKAAEAAVQAA